MSKTGVCSTISRTRRATTPARSVKCAPCSIIIISPSAQLARKEALATVAHILHTKIFVDLQQTLLHRCALKQLVTQRTVTKKPERRDGDAAIRAGSAKLRVLLPAGGIVGHGQRLKDNRQHVLHAGGAPQRHRPRGRLR